METAGTVLGPVPPGDVLRLEWYRLSLFLGVRDAARLSATPLRCVNLLRPLAEGQAALCEAHAVAADLEALLGRAAGPEFSRLTTPDPPTFESSVKALQALQSELHTEMRYVYGPDWEVKPGKLVSKKGTWLKTCTMFSWEIQEGPNANKLYLPHGIVMPILQMGRVTDPKEKKRHEWSMQHLCVWLKPSITQTLEARRFCWFAYWPHWEDKGHVIVPATDTWLKRTTQMSGELQPFELIYVPKGLQVRLERRAEVVEEEWEKFRHAHVHLHRKVTLVMPVVTVKQDQFDIFVGHDDADMTALQGWAPPQSSINILGKGAARKPQSHAG